MTNYDSSSIKILEGLEAVIKRPGMYIGSTDSRGLHHLVWEIVDNAIDEILNDFGDKIEVIIHKNNSITVIDNGRGIPVDMHKSGIPTSQVIFTVLHAGGKFGEGGYKTSGGLHGVGSSVVTALSKKVILKIKKDGYLWQQEFENNGKIIGDLQKLEKIDKKSSGTEVTFLPDDTIFSETKFSYKIIAKHLQESSFLINNLKINLSDERTGKEETFYYENGMLEFIDYLSEGKRQIIDPILINDSKNESLEINIGLVYTDNYNEEVVSFVNNVSTPDGGTHLVGFKIGLTKVFNELARENGFIKEKEKNLEGTDIREGLISIISVKIEESILQFEGQTKTKLGTPEARVYTENLIYNKIKVYFDQNKKELEKVLKKALEARVAREAAKKSRLEARKKVKNKNEIAMSGKLSPAQTKKVSERELFLVEGDSAGGSAKQGRNRYNQAILPLKGKVINTERARLEDILKNEELGTIVNILGAGIGSDFDVEQLKYNKIIIMTDADQDGAHIQILLLTFFYRYLRPLITKGHVYLAQPPLYKVSVGAKDIYAWKDDELTDILKTIKGKYFIQRYKGLGEMDAMQLWETTMDPGKRILTQITINDVINSEKEVTTLMGQNVDLRRDWIEANINFSDIDNFEIN